tara:strand:+ start:158 stop:448 length:291 start_codon:yes stop_codon:yes gene_type:complete
VSLSKVKKHYLLWTKDHCPWCKKAIDLLRQRELSHTVFAMDDKPEQLIEAKQNFGWKTVPIVYTIASNGETELIGGCTDLEGYLEDIDGSVQTTSS